MPINPNALGASVPESPEQTTIDEQTASAPSQPEEPAKRKRRTKAEMIADAVVPAPDDMVEVKDAGTGAKVSRPWHEAVGLVKSEQAEFVVKDFKYALLKYEQQQAAPAFAPQPSDNPAEREVRHTVGGQELLKTGEIGGVVTYSDENGSGTMSLDEWNLLSMTPAPAGAAPSNVPPEAELGDEVVVGADVLRLGHGRVLTSAPIADSDGNAVKPIRRWQRELGSGINGPWEGKLLPRHREHEVAQKETPVVDASNGHDDAANIAVDTERQPVTYEQVGPVEWKIGTGILEKIGLPDYSSLQIGPITASRTVIDDGRRMTVTLGNREASIPTVAVEVGQQASDVVEYIARYQRGELVSFLESTGALKQPVS